MGDSSSSNHAVPGSKEKLITTLVNQALDDIEVGRLAVADALRLIGYASWDAGAASTVDLAGDDT